MKKFASLKIIIATSVFLPIFLLLSFFYSYPIQAATSPDAIAVRIIPNPNHYSPIRWYQSQKFSGSPQSITVDGYDAVRDGRTVYVNVANIAGAKFYTNIYLISYNQSAEKATVDIFGQILQHWKFNTNIQQVGYCNKTVGRTCLSTLECAIGEYCTSAKSKIIRDTRRLSDYEELNDLLEDYKSATGYYPKLSSGSYLEGKTISVWPSWQGTLGSLLGARLPVDPINTLGACAENFNQSTCWDENEKRFADPSASDAIFDLPVGSNAYLYSATLDGADMSLSVNAESGMLEGKDLIYNEANN